MKCKTTSQSVKLVKKVMDNIKRGFLKVLQPLIKNDENENQTHLGIFKWLSFLLHPLLDF